LGSELELYLGSSNDAKGQLAFDKPEDEGGTEYRYDPNDPAPTLGGVIIEAGEAARFDPTLFADGKHDQRPLELRNDVIVYDSPVLTEVIRVAGSPTATIWISSSAEDTDFLVRLIDVEPDGYAGNLAEGVIRTRYREGGNDSWLTPGRPVELKIELDPVSHSFMPGHRIRVHVTSSSFPKFTRNLNSRVVPELGRQGDVVTASQKVFHGGDMASRITLHVVPASKAEWPYNSPGASRPARLGRTYKG